MDNHEKQTVEKIHVRDLVLWTENPRDPISSRSKNETVIRHALVDAGKKWEIKKLAKKMGARYDFSELPTVVYKNGAPIVYDGNRRVILAMLKLGLYPEFCDLKFGSSCMTVGGFPLHKFAWPLFYGLLSRSSGPRNFD